MIFNNIPHRYSGAISGRARVAAAWIIPLLIVAMTRPAFAAEPIGQILAIEGRVTARGGDGNVRELNLKSPVFAGDEIITGHDAKVQVFLLDDTTLSQGENSIMVIDEYVYDSSKNEGGAMIRFVRGVFRSITGRLTEANPDRFQIRTGRAVIGVRGCDLIFDVQEALERIYVLELPSGKSIMFNLAEPSHGRGALPDVNRRGRVVHIHHDGRYRERAFRLSTINELIDAVTPTPPRREPLRLGVSRAMHYGGGQTEDEFDDGGLMPPDQTPDYQPPIAPPRIADILDRDLESDPGLLLPPAEFADLQQDDQLPVHDPVPWPQPDLDPDPAPTPPPDPDPTPPPPERVARGIAEGMDWDWGFWDLPAGQAVDVYINGRYLTSAVVQDIIAGSASYRLSGSGAAGAVLSIDGGYREMLGIVDLSVRLGGGVTPSWAGAFSLAGDRNRLDFNAGGGMTDDGTLQGRASTYYLNVDGRVYDDFSLTGNHVGGRLTGRDDGITGVVGDFLFLHGDTGPGIRGGYGADLHGMGGY